MTEDLNKIIIEKLDSLEKRIQNLEYQYRPKMEKLIEIASKKERTTVFDIQVSLNVSRPMALEYMKRLSIENDNFKLIKGSGQKGSFLLNITNLSEEKSAAILIIETMKPESSIKMKELWEKYGIKKMEWPKIFKEIKRLCPSKNMFFVSPYEGKPFEEWYLVRRR
ncbi:MAG: hypothetical protein GTN40_05555 [Candidatus Aenigmarchaeota archaeon]|nr:hypothetical protein [Candidatus Aenigmarchaeota archaeon]